METELRVAIIGLGVIGNVHAEALKILEKNVVALCDIDVSKAEKAKEKYAPSALIYADYEKMLAEVKPTVVHICTPHDCHAEMIIKALSMDINVLCEKPLCIKIEDIDRIIDAEEKSKGILGVCHQNRYNETTLFLKDYLSDKKMVAAHASVVWHRSAEYYNSAQWRGTEEHEGGGALINQALHTLDLMMWLCKEPTAVSAIKDNFTLNGVIETEDTIAARFWGENDFTFYATVSSGCDFPVQLQFKLASGENIVAFSKVILNGTEVMYRAGEQKLLGKKCYGDGHIKLFDDYYDCVLENRPFAINGKEASKVVRMILGAYASEGEIISL